VVPGFCTLRAALELANGISSTNQQLSLLISLRAGRFRLAAPLPEIRGQMELAGSAPGEGPRPQNLQKQKGRSKQLAADEADEEDPYFAAAPQGANDGQTHAIGTSLDGSNKYQLIRVASNANLVVRDLRFEFGFAVNENDENLRASAGGAVNSLGMLAMFNVAIRGCRAFNGGAVYIEGKFEMHRAVIEGNFADKCGGFIYTAGNAAIHTSRIANNGCGLGDCSKEAIIKRMSNPKQLKASSDDDDDDDDDAEEAEKKPKDAAAAAIAEGPPLSGRVIAQLPPFSARPEGAMKKEIRMLTSRQLRELLDKLNIDYPDRAPKDYLASLAYEKDIFGRTKKSGAGNSAEPPPVEEETEPQPEPPRQRVVEPAKPPDSEPPMFELPYEEDEERIDPLDMELDELEALVARELEAKAAAGWPLTCEEEEARWKKVRLKTSRQLREALDFIEVEYDMEADKDDLRRLAFETDAVAQHTRSVEEEKRGKRDKKKDRDRDRDRPPRHDDFDNEEWEERMRRRGRPPPAPRPQKAIQCEGDKHGGDGGAMFELSCEAGLWPTGGKVATECIKWRGTNRTQCDPDGDLDPARDRDCFEFVPSHEPGYCECAGGGIVERSTCDHAPFTCQQACKRNREARRRAREAEHRVAGESVPYHTPAPKLFAIGAFGHSTSMVNSIGLICSDGSRTAIAGTAKEHMSRWEFVCPGWTSCKDENDLCATWAKQGECSNNAEWMVPNCAWSCKKCPSTARLSDDALGVVTVDVRGGMYVDAVRFRCGNALGEVQELDMNGTNVALSPWQGGHGGDECALDCDGTNHTEAWRQGGIVRELRVSAGNHVDSVELARCSEDIEM